MGLYPTAPSRRMAWDLDGTIAAYRRPDTNTQLSTADSAVRTELNDEDEVPVLAGFATHSGGESVARPHHVAFIFPELREFDGFFAAFQGSSATKIDDIRKSGNSTNALDGTFDLVDSVDYARFQVFQDWRNNVRSEAATNCRVVRFECILDRVTAGTAPGFRAIHLYGEISPGETPDRLLFIDESTGLEFALPKDYEEVPRGSARDMEWRLKNNSTVAGNNVTLTTIQFNVAALFLASASWYTHSVGGDGFAATKLITSLAPEASSSLIVTRQIVPTNAQLGLHAARIQATVGSLT